MAKGFIGASGCRAYLGAGKLRKGYIGAAKVYSAGNIVTYHVDTGVTYREEVDEGEGCLSPKTFTPAKPGWTFVGWRINTGTAMDVYDRYVMGGNPVDLYAVFRQTVTVTYYDNNRNANTATGYRYYNNGAAADAKFSLTQTGISGWTPRGWSTGTEGDSPAIYSNGVEFTRDSNVTLYGMYKATITLTYYNGSATALSVKGARYYCPGSGSVINPAFTMGQASLPGWTPRGWSTGTGAAAAIAYGNGASVSCDRNTTLYGMYYQTITLTTYNGSSSPTSHSGTRYYCPGSGSVVNPTFTVAAADLSGWSFVGWCTSSGAAAAVAYGSISGLALSASTTLYGRYSQGVSLYYNGNGSTGGSVVSQTAWRYFNSGNVYNPTFTLSANAFSRSGYNFSAWALGGTQYAPGASVTLSASATVYAVWTAIPATPFYLHEKSPTYTTSGSVASHGLPNWPAQRWWWQIQRNGIYARSETSRFSRSGCTKVKFTLFLKGGYFYVGNKVINLHGLPNDGVTEHVIDISDQPDMIACAIQAEGDGDGDLVQIMDPYFY